MWGLGCLGVAVFTMRIRARAIERCGELLKEYDKRSIEAVLKKAVADKRSIEAALQKTVADKRTIEADLQKAVLNNRKAEEALRKAVAKPPVPKVPKAE